MSGPKYYSFPMNSPEEAAGIYAQLSSFRPGVKISVENNELKFTVSNSAWGAGVDYSTISEKVHHAKERYAANEEMKRILREQKAEEVKRIRAKKSAIESSYAKEMSKLKTAFSQCKALEKSAQIKVDTPFGSYGLPDESKKISEMSQTISAQITTLEREYKSCLQKCDDSLSDVEGCNSLSEIDKLQRNYNALDISISTIDKDVEEINHTVQNKIKLLKNYARFLQELYRNMQNKGLAAYFDRIKSEVSRINIYDGNASEKVNAVLIQIEKEIEALRKRDEIHNANDEIRRNIKEGIEVLNSLKEWLRPVIKCIESTSIISADYSKISKNTITECEKIISQIEGLEFVNGDHFGKIDSIKKRLQNLRKSIMSVSVVTLMQNILKELREMDDICKKDNDLYKRFKAEQELYLEQYIKLQGILSAEDSILTQDDSKMIIDPHEVKLVYKDPEAQIANLKNLNKQLREILNQCFQNGACAAFSASVQQSAWGIKFKKEKTKDGAIHIEYVRKADKGVIFDVSCDKEGKIGVYPRGVVLYNGKTTISPEKLRSVHSSCAWADELTNGIRDFGIESTAYEEMPASELMALYDIANYYHIKTLDESIAFLKLSGYSEEEIDRILEIKTVEEVSDDNSESANRATQRAAENSKK